LVGDDVIVVNPHPQDVRDIGPLGPAEDRFLRCSDVRNCNALDPWTRSRLSTADEFAEPYFCPFRQGGKHQRACIQLGNWTRRGLPQRG
jgi:hypothetical protein